MPTIKVLDADSVEQLINTTNPNGQNTKNNSAPVVIASDQTAIPVSGSLEISNTTLPLPTGAATVSKQDVNTAAVTLIGTRSYGAGLTRIALGTTSVSSSAITATEVLLHTSAKCFISVNATATVNDIPMEAGEKFHLRVISGNTINVVQEISEVGFLNIVPVV